MALALAVQRTWSFYEPPVRRWVRRNVMFAFFWSIGLCTGLYSAPVNHDRVTAAGIVGLLALWALKHWSATATAPDVAPPARG